ncbi:MAG: hypothetical protein U0W24_01380 [Bacteroidales bacterium]
MSLVKKIIIISCILNSGFFIIGQEMIISKNAKIEALPGTLVILANGMDLVNNSDTLVLSGNYVFQGTLPQKIAGGQSVEFDKLTIEQGAFLSLYNDIKVQTSLVLNSGIIDLMDKNITLTSNSSVTGTFSENNMIAAGGSGKLSYEIPVNGTYLFPVGDTSGVNEYSPVSITFNKGTYNNAIVSVNLKNTKHPNNSSTSNYITRFWTVSQSGITDFECDVNFNYAVGDVHGNESDIYGGVWDGISWTALDNVSMSGFTGKVSSLGDFTGGELETLSVNDLLANHVEILSQNNQLIIKSDDSYRLKQVEIYNPIGQKILVKDLSRSNMNEIYLNPEDKVILVRIIAENQYFTKKIILP